MADSGLLGDFLQMTVPLKIAEFQARGGPGDLDWERVRAFGPILAEKGDQILYRDRETARLAGELVFVVAAMAFGPGGVKLFGHRWEV
jgi:hypothetical protein